MNQKLSKSDKKWQTFNRRVEKYIEKGDLFMLGTTYYEMAYFLKKENKEYKHLIEKGYEMKKKSQRQAVQRYLTDNNYIKGIEVFVNKGSCSECEKHSGEKKGLEEAIKSPPVPIKECAFEPYGCRCSFIPIV